jgi:nucleoside-triphosphatase THEP1
VITILTGPIGGGKTTFLRSVVIRLGVEQIPFDGYLSERVLEGGELRGYDLTDLRTGVRLPFLRRSGPREWPAVGQFVMDPNGLAAAERIIARGLPADLLILDELGRLESEGRGVWPVACPVLADPRRDSLVVIREGLLDSYRSRWEGEGVPVRTVCVTDSADSENFLRELTPVAGKPDVGIRA